MDPHVLEQKSCFQKPLDGIGDLVVEFMVQSGMSLVLAEKFKLLEIVASKDGAESSPSYTTISQRIR